MIFSETLSREEKRRRSEDNEKDKDRYHKRTKRFEEFKEKSPECVIYID